MEHLLLKAATTVTTDEGVFEAVISAASIDREKDIVDPAGMVRALQKWVPTRKKIPLAWQHSTAPEDQIGYIDPATARVVGNEVAAKGWIDQSVEVGQHAWRLVKMGTLGFSFGYLVPEGGSVPRKGGGRLLKELDVFEVTATPGPMNNDTRVLGWKAAATGTTLQILNSMIGLAQRYIDAAPDSEDVQEMQGILDDLNELVSDVDDAADQAEDQEDATKAVWDTSYVNDLPDSAFLYVEGGGSKDADGKTTPRSLRHFPYKDSSGAVDLPHLRNALARIPQSNLSQDVKDRLTAKAQRILDQQKSVDVTDRKARSVDPLRRQADAVALEFASDGESRRKSPKPSKPAPKPELMPLGELKQRMREEMLTALSGGLDE